MTALAAPLARRHRSAKPVAGALALVLVVIAASLAGATAVARISPAAAFAGVAAVAVVVLAVRRPAAGALLLLTLVAALPHAVLFERGIPLGGGALKVTDLLLALVVGSWVASVLGLKRRPQLPSLPTTLLLLAAVGVAVLSVVVAHDRGTPTKISLLELRPLLTYLLVFPIVGDVRSRKEVERGVAVFLAACAVAGLETVWRYVHGEGGVASYTGGAIRVSDSFFMFPMLAAVWVAVLLPTVGHRRARVVLPLLGVLSLAALFFTFQRGAWLAFLAGIAIVLLRLAPVPRARLVLAFVPLVVAGVVGILVLNAASSHAAKDPLLAGLDRLTSVDAFRQDVSGRYRLAEWSAAGEEIARHPLTGIGLGSTISFWSPMYSDVTRAMGGTTTTYYIHSSYVWFALKLGIPGALLFVSLLLREVLSASRWVRRGVPEGAPYLPLGALATLVALLVVAAFGAHLNADFATPYIAAAVALVELSPRLVDRRVRRAEASPFRPPTGGERPVTVGARRRSSSDRSRIVVFDWHAGGHHETYLHRVAEALQESHDVTVAAPTRFANAPAAGGYTALPLGDPRPPTRDRREDNDVAEEEIRLLAGAIEESGASLALHLYSDPILERLASSPPIPVPVSVTAFYARWHYPWVFRSALPPRDAARALLLEHAVARWRSRSDAGPVFALDPTVVERWNRRSGARVFWLPEPPLPDLLPAARQRRRGCLLYGALAPRKGIDRIAAALASGDGGGRTVTLAGPVEPGFETALARHVALMRGSGCDVDLRPYAHTESEGLALLGAAACAALPYHRHGGMSRVLVEAAAMGTPVLAHDYGLVGALVRGHRIGAAIDCDDPHLVRRTLDRLEAAAAAGEFEQPLREFAAVFSRSRFRGALRAAFAAEAPRPSTLATRA